MSKIGILKSAIAAFSILFLSVGCSGFESSEEVLISESSSSTETTPAAPTEPQPPASHQPPTLQPPAPTPQPPAPQPPTPTPLPPTPQPPSPAPPSNAIQVSSMAELKTALNNAKGGESIAVAPGSYGRMDISNKGFSQPVTIMAADSNNRPRFSEFYVKNSSNIVFDGMNFDYTFGGNDGFQATRFIFENSQGLTVKNSLFDGDNASGTGTIRDGLGNGKGVVIRGTDQFQFLDNELHTWWTAVTINTSTNALISGNDIHTIRSDGMKIGRVDKIIVEKNYIHDFKGAQATKDHRDMIQLMRSSAIGCNDVTIRNNVFDQGAGIFTQTLWAGGDKADANVPNNWHRNVLVENNIIYNSHSHGISMHLMDGLVVQRNTVIGIPRTASNQGVTVPKITLSGLNVTLKDNLTPSI